MGTYIPTRRLPALGAYKYAGEDRSLVSKYVLGPFWNWLVARFPRTVAPNTITVSGLGLVFINFLTLVVLDFGLECGTSKVGAGGKLDLQGSFQPGRAGDRLSPVPILPNFGFPSSVHATRDASAQCIPNWIYLTWAVGLFAYQSLDAIDGKQARRTGMAGPLGELFDHGCDAINTTLECLLCCSALNAGRSYWTIASVIATLSNFYLTTWEEYHTGVLFLSAFSGPVEGILMICAIYFITGMLPGGPSFWDRGILSVTGLENIPAVLRDFAWLNFPLNESFLTFGAIGLGANVVASYGNVARARSKRGESAISPVTGLLPLIAQLGAMVAWASANDAAIMVDAKAFLPFIAAWGLLFAYTVGILIVSHVTKAPFPYWNAGMVMSAVGAMDARLPSPIIQSSPVAIRASVYALLGLSVALYLFFAHDVITTITTYTGKPCFSVVVENLDKVDDPYTDAGKKKN